MRISKILLMLSSVGAIALVPTVANAQPDVFTFDVPDGEWNKAINWDPPFLGPPGADDIAVIPADTKCRVTTANQEALTVKVQNGGQLYIEDGLWLTIYGTVESSQTAITVESGGSLFLQDDGAGGPSIIIFKGPDNNEVYDFLITGPGTFTAAGQTGRLETPIGLLSQVVIDVGAKIEGSIEFERLSIENKGTLYVSGSDEMTIGTAIGGVTVVGDGEFTVDGANAVMSFSDTTFVVDGPIEVTDGLLEFTNPTNSFVTVFGNTLLVDGGTVTVAGKLLHRGTATTVQNGGSLEIDDDLEMDLNGHAGVSLTLTSGAVNVSGALLLEDADVTVSGGTLAAASVDAEDSTITVSGGAFDVAGTFATERATGTMSLTVSGGDLDMNLFDIVWQTTVTVSSGTIDAGSVACDTSTVLVSGGTFTVAGVYNSEASSVFPNSITVSSGELELNGAYTGGGATRGTDFTVSGGTLDINATFNNTGNFSYSAATITVVLGKIATFVP